MSRCSYIICDGCGTTLHLPTNEAAAARWELLSRTIDGKHVDLHWCGDCGGRERIIKRLEMAR